jgi:hypothetical protein
VIESISSVGIVRRKVISPDRIEAVSAANELGEPLRRHVELELLLLSWILRGPVEGTEQATSVGIDPETFTQPDLALLYRGLLAGHGIKRDALIPELWTLMVVARHIAASDTRSFRAGIGWNEPSFAAFCNSRPVCGRQHLRWAVYDSAHRLLQLHRAILGARRAALVSRRVLDTAMRVADERVTTGRAVA